MASKGGKKQGILGQAHSDLLTAASHCIILFNMKIKRRIFLPFLLIPVLALVLWLTVWEGRDKVAVQAPLLIQERPLVTYTEGECFYRTKGQSDWTVLETGTRLSQGTSLRTGENGRVDIRLNRESLICMDENTLTDLDKISVKSVSIDHREGRLYAKFHKLIKDQSYKVVTPQATAGIRGTELVFDTDPQRTVVYALSGITEVSSRGGKDPLLLSYDSYTRVREGQSPEEPRKIGEEEMRELQDRLNGIHEKEVLHISYRLLFEANSSVMLASSSEELEEVFELIDKGRFHVEIAGHTALVGDPGAMYSLSLDRAKAVREELIAMGIRPRRLSVQGYGATRPVADNGTEEGRALNRRVEFTVTEP